MNNPSPLVSIILTTYNRDNLLLEAIQSVLTQTYPHWELIIVDDGSTDQTAQLVHKYTDPRICYTYQQNSGLAQARNTGLCKAQGKYVAFLDDDDLFLPHKLTTQVALLESHPQTGLVAGGYYLTTPSQQTIAMPWINQPKLGIAQWLFHCPFIGGAVLIQRRWLEQVGGFYKVNRQVDQAEDWDLWMRLAYEGCHMEWVKEIVCIYRIHQTNVTYNIAKHESSLKYVLDSFFSKTDIPPYLREMYPQVYGMFWVRTACQYYAVGNFSASQNCLQKAIQQYPTLLENDGAMIVETLTAWAAHYLVKEPFAYLEFAFAHLPSDLNVLRKHRHQAISNVAMGKFFRLHQEGFSQKPDRDMARQMWLRGIWHNPRWLLNFGVWSILLQSYNLKSFS